MLILADCRPLPPISVEFALTVSPHAAFENRRCLETPFLVGAMRITSVRRGERQPLSSRAARHSFSPTGWNRHGMGTLPSLGATLTLPHPCPSSSPLSIGRDGCFRLHRILSVIEASRPRDAPPQHPMQPNLPQNPRTRMHQPLQIFISPLSLGGPIVDEDFSPSTYAVSKPISIAYARTCDAFLMSRLVWPAGICVACSICAAISQHTHPSVCRTTPHDLCIAHRQTRS